MTNRLSKPGLISTLNTPVTWGYFILKKEVVAIDNLQFYTVPEVAKILRVKKSFVYELVYTGRLKAIKLSERRLRIPDKAVSEFIEKEIEN